MDAKVTTLIEAEVKHRGWSYRELSRRAGLSESSVSKVVSGDRAPTANFCVAIAGAFGESPEHLLRLAGILPDRGATTAQHEALLYDIKALPTEDFERAVRMVHGLAGTAQVRSQAPQPPTNTDWHPTPEQCDVAEEECPRLITAREKLLAFQKKMYEALVAFNEVAVLTRIQSTVDMIHELQDALSETDREQDDAHAENPAEQRGRGDAVR